MRKINILIFSLFIISYAQIGRVSTAGYTTWDWQFNGPTLKWCIIDTVANGIHIAWTWCDGISANRNVRYNFYNFATRTWNWPNAGVNVFTVRAGYGSIDNNPVTGCVYICANSASGILVGGDMGPGTGIFEYFQGLSGFLWPVIAVTPDSVIHLALMDAASQDSLWYSRRQPGGNWSTPIHICPPAPEPMFPSHNLVASKVSNKVIILWECAEDQGQQRVYYRLSHNSGITWQPPTQLPFPPAQEMTPSFHISSLYAVFDYQDNIHIVASVADTGQTIPAGIWHWCPINNPQWSCIYFYNPETLHSPNCGYNAIYATRPTIVQNHHDNYFYVAWEQFDYFNYEPSTSLARADVWIAESPNNGQTWQNQRPITTPNTTSKRFPCAGGVDHDTLTVAYLIDSIAGFELYAQGRYTFNPVVIQRIKVPLPTIEIKENSTSFIHPLILNIEPNPFTSHTAIRFSLPTQTNVSLSIYDVTGRLIKVLVSDIKTAGEYFALWNGKDNQGLKVKNGIYFCSLKTNDKVITRKVVKSD